MTAPIAVDWLGQAGFLIRAATARIAIDPYLSDECERVYGLRRQIAPPVPAQNLRADFVLVSHWHEDHLDLGSVTALAESGSVFIAPPSVIDRLRGRGVAQDQRIGIIAGQTVRLGDAAVTAVPARHRVPGYLTEDAVGFRVEIGGVRIYHSGDTDYDRSLLQAGVGGSLDLVLLCSNGTGGNMNVWEAATLAAQLRTALVVPMHFGMWAPADYGPGATLDPRQFCELYRALQPEGRVAIPSLSEPILLDPPT